MSAAAFHLEAPIGGSRLSRLDLSQADIVRDAEAALHRCRDEADHARWARTWGAPAIERLHETEDYDDLVYGAELVDAEAELDRAEKARDELKAAIKVHVESMDRIMEGASDALINSINDAIAKLENLL